MTIEHHRQKAIEMIDSQLSELSRIMQQATQDFDYEAGEERIRRWKARVVKLLEDMVHPQEGDNLVKKHAHLSGTKRTQEIVEENIRIYRSFLLGLKDRMRRRPEEIMHPDILTKPAEAKPPEETPVLSPEPASAPAPQTPSQPEHERKVFIVFGRDELNSLRLEKHIREQGVKNVVLLNTIAGKNGHLTEKLEQEARWDSCAMFVFTPEDFVKKTGSKVPLVRPEFLFGLGWFCGKFSHRRVCVFSRKGAKFPPGLADFVCIEFEDSVTDAAETINQKLLDLGFD